MMAIRQIVWLVSDYDNLEHAFHADSITPDAAYLEALCKHSAPPDHLAKSSDTVIAADTCIECVLKHAEDVAAATLADLTSEQLRWL
jgi:hypothetical protein